ncbi:MAG: cytidylate kinase-like family protein [Prevotella sp.]|jgi:cytidylate kinase|nr:cytidylate kinase-like family protein [Prevotella sp.]MCI2081458.1 cytidylate kinase-like family protein [Prevotella sp.]MCI2103335.1 cytidylate kinase-like family protein [Prevotella sp.]HCN54177.1 cytidylate kinase-like family protein [Prevotella sp.]
MNRKERFVITINRQFGTGGHEIGQELADRLGVKLIDKQLLLAVADKFHLTEKEAQRLERRRPSWWDDFSQFYQGFMSMHEYQVNPREITSRQLFYAQAEAMKRIAEQESCVVIGRCGFDVFRDHPNKLSLFIHSSLNRRIARIEDRYQVDEQKARVLIEDNDYTRELYTKTFTGKDWYDARNYDLTLDVTRMGVYGAIDFLLRFVNE